jgi:hypothetical protein
MSDQKDAASKSDKSADQKQCINLKQATVQTVTLAFELFDRTVLSSPELLVKVLESKSVQDAIRGGLESAGKQLMTQQEGGKPVEFGGTMEILARAAAKAAKAPAKKVAVDAIKKTREYQQFDAGLKEFKCAFEQSPVGMFVDKHKGLLIVVGVIGALGGGVAMYYAKAGDLPAKAFSLVQKMKPIKLGAISLHADKVLFKPSERQVEVGVSAKGDWSTVKASLELRGSVKNDGLKTGAAKGQLVYSIDPKTTISVTGSGSWAAAEPDKRRALTGAFEVEGKRQLSMRSDLSIRIFGNYDSLPETQGEKAGVGLSYGRKDVFGKGTGLRGGIEGTTGFTQKISPQVEGAARDNRLMLRLELSL